MVEGIGRAVGGAILFMLFAGIVGGILAWEAIWWLIRHVSISIG